MENSAATPIFIHASAVVLGESGVLIRGASGAGKSSLALALIEAWNAPGAFARLVGDDRVQCQTRHGHVVISPHRLIAGLAEWRGLGLTPHLHEIKAVLRLIVDLESQPAGDSWPRLPDCKDFLCDFNGVTRLPYLRLPARDTYRSVATIMAFLHKHSTK